MSTSGISPINPIVSPITGTQNAHFDCLKCGETFEVWIFYHNTVWNGNSIAGNYLTSQMTFAKRFDTPECSGGGMRKGKGNGNGSSSHNYGYKVYPNPANTDFVFLEYRFEYKSTLLLNITLYSIVGEKVLEVNQGIKESSTGLVQIPISNLSQGSYIVSINDGYIITKMQLIVSE